MAEENQDSSTQKLPKNRDELKESIRRRVAAAHLQNNGMASHIINEINQMIDSTQGDIGQIASSAVAAADVAIAVARDAEAHNQDEARLKGRIIKGIEQTFEHAREQELQKQEALEAMSKKLASLQTSWNETRDDGKKLQSLMDGKQPLEEEVLRNMKEEELRRLEIRERAELALLEANLERQRKLYNEGTTQVIDTGRKIGVKGDDETVLRTMENAAEKVMQGKQTDLPITRPQAEQISNLKTQRQDMAVSEQMVEVQQPRVEQIIKMERERGIPLAMLEDVKQVVRNVGKEMSLSPVLIEAAVKKVEALEVQVGVQEVKLEKQEVKLEKKEVKLEMQEVKVEMQQVQKNQEKEKALESSSQDLAEALEIPLKPGAPLSECLHVFKQAQQSKRFSGEDLEVLEGFIKDLERHQMEKMPKEDLKHLGHHMVGNNQEKPSTLGKHTQNEQNRVQNNPTHSNDRNGWGR